MANKRFDVTRALAFDMMIKRALEGDEQVLLIAMNKAKQGNRFAKLLLDMVDAKLDYSRETHPD